MNALSYKASSVHSGNTYQHDAANAKHLYIDMKDGRRGRRV